MSKVGKLAQGIRKKMGLSDYVIELPQTSNTPIPPRKTKMSIYLTSEHVRMFNEMCMQEMRLHGKPMKSELICQAIELLYRSRLSLPTS